MNFTDQIHLLQLQQDLWQWPTSRAAVMVGAGFSLNAQPLPGVSSKFPTWSQLVRAMFDELYPIEDDPTEESIDSRQKYFAAKNPLRLASEYEAAFERRKLENLIKRQNPDSQHLPGTLHRLLLQLPWKDVFTTNYDTLLERTEISGRSYQCVTSASELTTSFPPRIVKLHGSFPSTTPFIITEEDYRTYPRDFSPFVNTVQQCLIENSLVLIGFSGDDPNFLQWIGWIRDNFLEYHAPIYLVGLQNLGSPQRTLLERRGVTPIDLSPVFSNNPSQGNIHNESLEWFFRSLASGKPKRPDEWLKDLQTQPNPEHLPPILYKTEIPSPPPKLSISPNFSITNSQIQEAVLRWAYERNNYPGWLVAPKSIRESIWNKSKYWNQQICKLIPRWSLVDRILCLREMVWRLDTAMIPLLPYLNEPMRDVVDEFFILMESADSFSASIPKSPHLSMSREDIIEAWLELVFADIQEARETYNSTRWNKSISMVKDIQSRNSATIDRIHYEEALWWIWNSNRLKALENLKKWIPSNEATLSLVWKAGLLAELDELDEARTLLKNALSNIRNAVHVEGQNIELLSQEGWCTYLISLVDLATDIDNFVLSRDKFTERWKELKSWDCDPWTSIQYFEIALNITPPVPKPDSQSTWEFDPDTRTETIHLMIDNFDPVIPAFSLIRLYEKVGIPMKLPGVSVLKNPLANSCEWIAPFIGYWSPAILIRTGELKKLTNYDLMSRVGIATTPTATSERLHAWCFNTLRTELENLSNPIESQSSQESLLVVAPELLSRLTFTVNEEELARSFDLAMDFYSNTSVQKNANILKTCRPWFKRIFYAASEQNRLRWVPNLIDLEIPEVPENIIDNSFDPLECLPQFAPSTIETSDEDIMSAIHSSADNLLKRVQLSSRDQKYLLLERLLKLFKLGLLRQETKTELSIQLWEDIPENQLPDLPSHWLAIFLQLPNPDGIEVQNRVRSAILDIEPEWISQHNDNGTFNIKSGRNPHIMINEVVQATNSPIPFLQENIDGLDWSLDEVNIFWNKILSWWDNDKVILNAGDGEDPMRSKRDVTKALSSLDFFIAKVMIPKLNPNDETKWNELDSFAEDAKHHNFYLVVYLPYLLLQHSEKYSYVEQSILEAFSTNTQSIRAAAVATYHWLHLANDKLIMPPGTDLLDELISRITLRRREGIHNCCSQLASILVELPDVITLDHFNKIATSLYAWHDSTKLPTNVRNYQGEFNLGELPGLRQSIGEIAGALSNWLRNNNPELPEPASISDWRKSCEQDKLPEVKRAFVKFENRVA